MTMRGVSVIHILSQGSFVFPRQGKGFVNQWLSSKLWRGNIREFLLIPILV
jgi:hypothetical protein